MALSNLKLRVISALVLAPVVLGAVWFGDVVFGVLVALMAGIGLGEWHAMTDKNDKNKRFFRVIGALYIGGGSVALLYLRGLQMEPQEGLANLLYVLLVVWATDCGAYFSGKLIGGPKILPRISPKKTWAGLIGGMLSASVTGIGVVHYFSAQGQGSERFVKAALIAAMAAIIAQAGDFFESFIKRRAGVKDSGSLIPGHGGVLDRIDGLLTAAMFIALCRAAGWLILL